MVPDFWHRPVFDPLHAKKMATWFCKKNEMFRSQACWPCTPDPPWPMTLIQDVKRFHIFLRCSIEHASHAQMNLNLIGNWGPWHVFSLLSEGKQQWWGDQRWFTTKRVSKLNLWVQQRCLGRFLRSWRRQHESWKTGMESPGFCGWDMDVLVWINGRGPSVLRLCLSSPWKDCWKSHVRTSKCDWENGRTTVPTVYPFLKCPRVFRRNLPGFLESWGLASCCNHPHPPFLDLAIGSAFDHKLLQYQSYKVGLPRDIWVGACLWLQ